MTPWNNTNKNESERINIQYQHVAEVKKDQMFKETIELIRHDMEIETIGLILRDNNGRYISIGFEENQLLYNLNLQKNTDKKQSIYYNALSGDLDTLTFNTIYGTTWTNNLPEFFATPDARSDATPGNDNNSSQSHFNDNGVDANMFSSLVLVPLRLKGKTIGLLHASDPCTYRFDCRSIDFFEKSASVINRILGANAQIPATASGKAEFWAPILNETATSICILDADMRIVNTNEAAINRFYTVTNEPEDQKCHSILHGQTKICKHCPSLYAIKLQKVQKTIAYFDNRVDHPIEIIAIPIKDNSGNITGIIHIAKNATKHLTSNLVTDIERWFIALTESVIDSIMLLNESGKIIFWNKTAESVFGYRKLEIIGKHFSCLIPELANDLFDDLADITDNNNIKTSSVLILSSMQATMSNTKGTVELSGLKKNMNSFPIELSLGSWGKGENRFYAAIIRDISERKKVEKNLTNSHEELRRLSTYLLTAREEERASMAREIHDELGQELTALKMDIAWLNDKADHCGGAVLSKLTQMGRLVDQTIDSVKKIATELRPNMLDNLGIIASIEWQLAEFTNRFGIENINDLDQEISLDAKQSITLFRILQEALTNIVRHARATIVRVALKSTGNTIILTIADNGIGIKDSDMLKNNSFGILGIKERALCVGGNVLINVDNGTCLTIQIPLANSSCGP